MGLRDSGNHGPVLVNGALVPENAIVPGKYVYCKGAFDERNVSHKLPVAKIKIRSPHFGFDDDVEIKVAVCKSMPSGIDLTSEILLLDRIRN